MLRMRNDFEKRRKYNERTAMLSSVLAEEMFKEREREKNWRQIHFGKIFNDGVRIK